MSDLIITKIEGHPLPAVWPGFKRAWLKCRTCGFVGHYQYQPYSFSRPMLELPCGHMDHQRISPAEAVSRLTAEPRAYARAARIAVSGDPA